MRRAALALLALGAGCSRVERFDAPREGLDQVLFYTEQERRGEPRPISGTKDVERVPKPGLVDVDSRLAISVRKDKILGGEAAGDPLLSRQARELEARERELIAVARSLDELTTLKRGLADAYAATEREPSEAAIAVFETRRRALGVAEQAFIRAVRALFPAESEEAKAINRALFEGAERGLAAARPFFEAALKAADAAQEKLASDVRARRLTLRLEAYLESADQDRTFIHLEHYDDLDQGKLQRRDPFGLDLGPRERERLAELMATSRELAERLNAVRSGERGLEEAFEGVTHGLTRRVAELAAEIRKLYADARAAKEGLKTLGLDLVAFAEAAKRILQDEAAQGVAKAVDELRAATEGLGPVLETLLRLHDAWRAKGVEALPELLLAAPGLARELDALVSAFRADAGWKTLAKDVETALEKVAGDARERVRQAWRESPARAKLEGLESLARRLMEAADPLLRAAGARAAAPAAGEIHTTSSFFVPVEKLKDTSVELERTPRRTGDIVRVQAALYRGQEEIDRSAASFEVREFGWHASLAPSVVLARPLRMESAGDEDFNFAPSLSWILRYTPRPEESDWLAPVRFLDAGLGVHAAFLNFDSEKEVEIGLGGTLSVWGDRLIGGAGYNLMAEESDEGGWYFFVGSSLIALLQDLGVTK